MLIDHVGYLLLGCGILYILPPGDPRYEMCHFLYRVMRCVGRISFPVYAFLLTEGIVHTSSWLNYALRLGGFALLSEIPYDLMRVQKPVAFEGQNVFFTLLIGLLTVKAAERAAGWIQRWRIHCRGMGEPIYGDGWYLLTWMTAIGLGCVAAMLLRTDYSSIGVFLIVLLYYFRQEPLKKCAAGFLWMFAASGRMYYVWGFGAAFLLIYLYNGEQGSRRGKYAFYLFYPAHILVLYLIFCWLMERGGMIP
ncbi:MAG: conjugal transfer protein TraX [Lachnospiraceae bacterium]|nr:conjugal transfer protein TraX [Lachnospiraceae bacterium]